MFGYYYASSHASPISPGYLGVLYVNELEFQYKLDTDADEIDYRFLKDGIELESKKTKGPISLQVKEQGKYRLEYILRDEVYNKTSPFVHDIVVDTQAPKLVVENLDLCDFSICAQITASERSTLFDTETGKTYAQIDSNKQNIVLVSQWDWGKEYVFRLGLRDLAGNASNEITDSVRTPELSAAAGEVFGVTPKSPWGEDNKFQNKPSFLRLDIFGTNNYKWSGVIQEPLLTLADAPNGNIYGHAINKNSDVQVEIYATTPSIYETAAKCGISKSTILFKPLINARISCLNIHYHFGNFAEAMNSIERKCARENFWNVMYCYEKSFLNSSHKFLSKDKFKPQHSLLEVHSTKTPNLFEIWLENDSKFKISSANRVAIGDVLFAKSRIFGSFRFRGQDYSYRDNFNLSSLGSNFIQVKSSSVAVESKCNNISCRLLNISYFNQFIDENGKYEYWDGWQRSAGGQSCGAASAVMVSDFFGKLSKNNRLKSYVFRDNGLSLNNKKCAKPGAFAVTAYDRHCNQSGVNGIQSYLAQNGLQSMNHWPSKNNNFRISFDIVKKAIDQGRPLIISYSQPIGHILVVKGYTYQGQIVVNDPYRDIQNKYIKGIYDYTGKDAIYSLYPNDKFYINYITEVYQ